MMVKCELRKRALCMSLLAALACICLGAVPGSSAALQTQNASAQAPAPAKPTDIADTWQGTLHAGQDLRIEAKITKADGGGYKAVFYSIDQAGQPINADSITLDGSTVKMSLKTIGAAFEGKLSADGKTIDGNWSQGPKPAPLVLERVTADAAWPIPPPPKSMAADADPSFDVATIKPNNSGATQMQALVIRGRNFATKASSVQDLIAFAYNVQAKQIVAGPGWMGTDRFDIDALPDAEGVPNAEQIRVMIRKLLADRFKFTFHHEQREMDAYVLEVGKNGQKLTPNDSKGQLPGLGFRPTAGGLTLMVRNATIPDFTGFLQVLVLDRPVVDRTSLTGRYDFQCTFSPDDSQFGGHPPMPPPADAAKTPDAAPVEPAPGLYEALQQELGLKLTAEKTSVDVIAIDHIDQPSPN